MLKCEFLDYVNLCISIFLFIIIGRFISINRQRLHTTIDIKADIFFHFHFHCRFFYERERETEGDRERSFIDSILMPYYIS